VAGKRVGPAEVESILVGHTGVREAAVVGVPHDVKGTALVAVCVAAGGDGPGADELGRLLESELGKALRPDRVLLVAELPRTRNGKVMRRVVRAAVLGEDPGDTSSLENPEAVAELRRQAGHGPAGTDTGGESHAES
jgi:acetyl-CoA synthetase